MSTIAQRLSLHNPQRESLEILDQFFSATGMPDGHRKTDAILKEINFDYLKALPDLVLIMD